MKITEIQVEIDRLKMILERPQFLSAFNLRNLRKRKAKLVKQARERLEKDKIDHIKIRK